jgi:hypothetical protein
LEELFPIIGLQKLGPWLSALHHHQGAQRCIRVWASHRVAGKLYTYCTLIPLIREEPRVIELLTPVAFMQLLFVWRRANSKHSTPMN